MILSQFVGKIKHPSLFPNSKLQVSTQIQDQIGDSLHTNLAAAVVIIPVAAWELLVQVVKLNHELFTYEEWKNKGDVENDIWDRWIYIYIYDIIGLKYVCIYIYIFIINMTSVVIYIYNAIIYI